MAIKHVASKTHSFKKMHRLNRAYSEGYKKDNNVILAYGSVVIFSED